MAYASPVVAPSGATFAQFQAGGASGQLNLLIAANSAGTAAPTAAPTVSATGGGATGGLLAPGVYSCAFTETNGFGETTASPPSASFTVTAGDIPQATFPALKPGNIARSLYLTPAGGAASTAVLYARDAAASTLNLAAAAPAANYACNPPTSNGTTWGAKQFELAKDAKSDHLERVFERLRTLVAAFNHGEPVPHAALLANFRQVHGALALLNQLCSEVGALIDANPGRVSNQPTGIGGLTPRRTQP